MQFLSPKFDVKMKTKYIKLNVGCGLKHIINYLRQNDDNVSKEETQNSVARLCCVCSIARGVKTNTGVGSRCVVSFLILEVTTPFVSSLTIVR